MIKNQPCYLPPDDQTTKLLKLIADEGENMTLAGAILEFFPRKPPIPIAVMRYTFGPIIVHVTHKGDDGLGWITRDMLQKWRGQVSRERLAILCGECPDLVSPTEIWLVMHNATFAAPLQRDLAEIYEWACLRSYTASGREVPPELLSAAGGHNRSITDEEIFDGRLTHEYRLLCREIITKVVHNARGRQRSMRAALASDADTMPEEEPAA